jgi:flagellar hook assembly protein FlgD
MLGQNVPNPLASPTTIQFSIARATPVSIRVFDAAGRVVQELVNGSHDAGRYTVTWDGRDRRGRSLPPGIYLYRMSTPWFVQAKKFIVVR